MHRLGHETFSEVFGLKTVKAPAAARAKLRLGDGSPVTEIRRVRYLNREPVSIDYSWCGTTWARASPRKTCARKTCFPCSRTITNRGFATRLITGLHKRLVGGLCMVAGCGFILRSL